MRYVYATLIGVLIVIVVLFSLQNVSTVTISFLTMSATLPLALLVMLVYLSGVFTGGFVLALLRSWIHGASRK
jgi:lipopolysaccharide assembly protein A